MSWPTAEAFYCSFQLKRLSLSLDPSLSSRLETQHLPPFVREAATAKRVIFGGGKLQPVEKEKQVRATTMETKLLENGTAAAVESGPDASTNAPPRKCPADYDSEFMIAGSRKTDLH